MAKNASIFVKLGAILSLFLMIVVLAESRATLVDLTVACDKVIGVKAGDDCTSISQSVKLSLASFLTINPNINCVSIFVGQWVCVDGSVSK
ncbi:Peptidoglycan-binding lysin domain-containing protein [Cynara cardunculus var. scolymus]|uniref:Peptidoglycan-binding lysin domain-containing protein n=1 Tax=Cynara cardunculus var. scolymus TaxID=59895 RepID=A0A103XTX1_CYNCS|nr:Peptidoglycan-binding lysin domain-containing protein [Cynara cardunculus var. scolymus]